jgi:hypothetical protein
MAVRSLNLQSDTIDDLIELSEEEKGFSKISSESDVETIFRKYCNKKKSGT